MSMNTIKKLLIPSTLVLLLTDCTAVSVVDGVASLGVKAATSTVKLAAKGVGATAKGVKKLATDDDKDKKE